MKLPDFLFALLPPVLAIVLQYFSIPSERYLASAAATRQQAAGLPKEVQPMFLGMMQGALAVSSFTPTFLSVIVSTFALVYDRKDAIAYALILIIVTALVAIPTISSLSGYEPFALSTNKLKVPFGIKGFLPFTSIFAINALIYGANGILIALAILKFTQYLPNLQQMLP